MAKATIYLCSRLNTATKLPKITKCWLGPIKNTMIMRMIINNWMKLNTLQDLLDRPFSQWQYLTTTARIHLIRFGFLIQICKKKKYSPVLHKETTKWRILVVAVKWHHHTNIVLFFLGKWGDFKINWKIPINISRKNSTIAVQNVHVCALPYVNFEKLISWLKSHAVKLSEKMLLTTVVPASSLPLRLKCWVVWNPSFKS